MESTKFINGKTVTKKSKGTQKTLKKKLIEHNQVINDFSVIQPDRNPNLPPNWYIHQDLGEKEFNKRLSSLNKENLNIEQLKARLVQSEMINAYEHFVFNNMILPTHIEGRKAINGSIDHIKQSDKSRQDGVHKRNQPKNKLLKKIIDELIQEKRILANDDWRVFKLRAINEGLSEQFARNYWKEFTGFTSTKKFTQLKP